MIDIKSIWEDQKPTGDIIVRTRINEIEHLNCYAATNHITGQHLFVISISNLVQIPNLKNYRFKGVEVFTIESKDTAELYIYLLDNSLKDIFSMFIQDVMENIQNTITEKEALSRALNVVSNWRRLFGKINFNGLTIDQQKGLIGELLFLSYILDNKPDEIDNLSKWTSTERGFESKDFTMGSVGVEIKFSSSKQPRIRISNERQLDPESLDKLFLVLYSAEPVKDKGISLDSMVENIRNKIKIADELKEFNVKLELIGYFDDDKDHYNNMYSIKKIFVFEVASGFPRIVKSQLPLGVYDTSYSIEVSSIESYIVNIEKTLL